MPKYSLALMDDRNVSNHKCIKSDNLSELESILLTAVVKNNDYTEGEICLSNNLDIEIAKARHGKYLWFGYDGSLDPEASN